MEAVREELVTFEVFSDLDELTLQEVLVEMMREGSPGLILQQAPLSLRNRVRENLSTVEPGPGQVPARSADGRAGQDGGDR